MTYIPVALWRQVMNRAQFRCEYCRWHQNNALFTHEIDHIYAEKHGGETIETNLCVACAICNRYKSSDLCSLDPQTGDVVSLFHPRRDKWDDHFVLENNGVIRPLTATGRVTERVLNFNLIKLARSSTNSIKRGIY